MIAYYDSNVVLTKTLLIITTLELYLLKHCFLLLQSCRLRSHSVYKIDKWYVLQYGPGPIKKIFSVILWYAGFERSDWLDYVEQLIGTLKANIA